MTSVGVLSISLENEMELVSRVLLVSWFAFKPRIYQSNLTQLNVTQTIYCRFWNKLCRLQFKHANKDAFFFHEIVLDHSTLGYKTTTAIKF